MKNSNFLGGLGLLLFGGGYLWEALRYPLGTMRNIGPGGFPLLIGLVLVAIAVFLIVQGLMQASEEFRFPWRPFIMISLSIAVFAFLVKSVGLIAAVVAAVFVSSLSEPPVPIVRTAVLAVFLTVVSWFIFIFALGMPLQLVYWP